MGGSSTDASAAAAGDGEVAALLRGRRLQDARQDTRRDADRDTQAERAALARLARELADQPQRLQQSIADTVRVLCGAEAVVLAVLETGADGEAVRWTAASGSLADQAGARWPLDDCPSGRAVQRGVPVLLAHPERDFPSMRAPGLRPGETLGIPWRVDGRAAGALAAVLLDGNEKGFDADDLALLEICAGLAGAAQQACRRPDPESEARFRALADAAPVLVYQFDLDGKLIYLNQRCDPRAPARPADMDAYLGTVFDGIRKHNTATRRIHTLGGDGGWHWFESHVAPWYSDMDEQGGYVGISLDITGAVQTEEALREADRRKDEFLATLAHELRNPLAPISNAVQLLRRPDGRRQSDRVFEMVGRQVGQMIRLVDDLMEVSRIAHGKIDLKLERVAFAEIARGAVETSQPLVERSNHQLLVSLPEEALLLEADRVRLTQVFSNLLNNAAKYTDFGGRIWFDVRRDGDQLVASVRDTGIGIPPEALGRVFDMFIQAHRAVGRGHGGLGIGLTMVRSLVEMHRGTVEARSGGSGQGSEFVVRLPLAPQSAGDAPDAGEPSAAAPFAGQRILVVDDNRDAADTLGMLLEADGAEVRVVYDGRAALAMAESFLPTGVLLDIGMPGMDGFEVARRLRQDGRFASLRIVALTGWGQDADRRQTRNRGFSSHLTKPVSVEDLQRVLNGT